MKSIEDILKVRKAATKEALEVFDGLVAATKDFMLGRWTGFEIETNHQVDGQIYQK